MYSPMPCPASGPTSASVPKRILLVEDEPNDVELIMAVFERMRLAEHVAVAKDGEEALEYLSGAGLSGTRSHGFPVVVLLDLKLPKLDGFQVLQRIKSHPDWRQLPVVMLTSSRERRDVEASYRGGANAFVVKPVQTSELQAALEHLGRFWLEINEPPPGAEVAVVA